MSQFQQLNHEQKFCLDYQKLVHEIQEVKNITYPKLSYKMPIMDITIKVLFDEDL